MSTTYGTFCPRSKFQRSSYTEQVTGRFRCPAAASSQRWFVEHSSLFSTETHTCSGTPPRRTFLGLPAPARPASEGGGIAELSGREREILGLVAEGLSDAEIAKQLVLSPHTVHRHVANIRRKLGLRSRSAAAAAAARAGVV
jgi:DNA-binding CsgD family transcriptional regulator